MGFQKNTKDLPKRSLSGILCENIICGKETFQYISSNYHSNFTKQFNNFQTKSTILSFIWIEQKYWNLFCGILTFCIAYLKFNSRLMLCILNYIKISKRLSIINVFFILDIFCFYTTLKHRTKLWDTGFIFQIQNIYIKS